MMRQNYQVMTADTLCQSIIQAIHQGQSLDQIFELTSSKLRQLMGIEKVRICHLDPHHLDSLTVSLVVGGKPWGFLCLKGTTVQQQWTEAEITLVNQVGLYLSLAIEQNRYKLALEGVKLKKRLLLESEGLSIL